MQQLESIKGVAGVGHGRIYIYIYISIYIYTHGDETRYKVLSVFKTGALY